MCLLIVLVGVDPEFPVVVGSNRDERRDRKAAPPGLWVGERHRVLSPRDREAGGTWLGVGDQGLVAGLTNLAGGPVVADAPSRGILPNLALDADDREAAVRAVEAAVTANRYSGFQLVVTDGRASSIIVHDGGRTDVTTTADPVVVVSNEHRFGELVLPGLSAACAPAIDIERRLDLIQQLLLDTGERSGHRVLKRGGAYGTVSSSLIAVHGEDPRRLVWRFAPGPPDATPYRNYGNLARRLVEE